MEHIYDCPWPRRRLRLAICPPPYRLLSREHAPAVAHFAGYSTRTYTHTQLQDQLDEIRKHNERAGCGTRRAVLNTVLVQLADIDINLRMGPAERRKLLSLLSNMTGLKAAELRGFYAALELVVDPEAPVARPGGLKCDNKREFKTQEVLDKLDKLGAFELLLGDSTHPRPLNSMRGGAARMHEESVLRRKQSPPAPATIELEPGTLKLEPAAAPEVAIA